MSAVARLSRPNDDTCDVPPLCGNETESAPTSVASSLARSFGFSSRSFAFEVLSVIRVSARGKMETSRLLNLRRHYVVFQPSLLLRLWDHHFHHHRAVYRGVHRNPRGPHKRNTACLAYGPVAHASKRFYGRFYFFPEQGCTAIGRSNAGLRCNNGPAQLLQDQLTRLVRAEEITFLFSSWEQATFTAMIQRVSNHRP